MIHIIKAQLLASQRVMGHRTVFWTIFLYEFVLITAVTSQMAANLEQQLRRELFFNRKLDPLARPGRRPNDSSTTTIVFLTSPIYSIQQLDTRRNTLTTSLWLTLEWENPDLAWNPQEYGNVKSMSVKPELMWTPRVTLLNSLTTTDHVIYTRTNALLRYNGKVTITPPVTTHTYCGTDVQYFPFDQHTCSLVFGSWTHDGTHINISDENNLNMKSAVRRGSDFEITKIEVRRVTHRHTCCRELYTAKIFELQLTRRSSFYQVGILLPAALICLLTAGVFWVNPPKSQRLSLSSVLLVANLFLLIFLSFILPASSDGTPRIIIFAAHSLVFSGLALVLSVVAVSLSCQRPSVTPPNCVLELTRGWIGKLLPSPADDLDRVSGNAGWLLLVAFIDRICFVVYCVSFLIIFILYLQ